MCVTGHMIILQKYIVCQYLVHGPLCHVIPHLATY